MLSRSRCRRSPEEDFYADEFNARDEHALDILAKHGIDTERRPLGKGAMARVYALDGDHVTFRR